MREFFYYSFSSFLVDADLRRAFQVDLHTKHDDFLVASFQLVAFPAPASGSHYS